MNKVLFFGLCILLTCKISIAMNSLVPKLGQTADFELLWRTTTDQEKENCGAIWLLALRNFCAVRPMETEEGLMCPIRKCRTCESDQSRLEKHLITAHASQLPFACIIPWCCSRFERDRNVKDHLRKVHGIRVNPLLGLQSKNTKKRSRSSNPLKLICYPCPECNYCSTAKKNLWNHFRVIHKKSLSWIGNYVRILPLQHRKK